MDAATITAAAAICGSMVGALGSFVGTFFTQRYHDQRDLLAARMTRCEILYSDFITESARLLVDALEHNEVDPKTLVPAYALMSRIRIGSPPEVLAAADDVLKTIIATYPQPNLKLGQIDVETITGEQRIKVFSEVCRQALETMQRRF